MTASKKACIEKELAKCWHFRSVFGGLIKTKLTT